MTSSLLRTVFAALPFALLVACAGGAEEGTQGDDQNVKASHLGEAGTLCGGIAGIRCKAGLECNLSSKGPDASGTCANPKAQPGEAGGECAGFLGIQCKAGLRCVLDGPGNDIPGTCKVDDSKTPIATCQAIPACGPGETSVDSCADKDPNCNTTSLCGHTIHCQKPTVSCQAIPSCLPGDTEVDSCADKDTSCTTTSLCGHTIHCQKPEFTCQAIPSCLPEEEQVDSCAAKDTSCTTTSLCGHTIHCKKP
jgi:hypothetical protein